MHKNIIVFVAAVAILVCAGGAEHQPKTRGGETWHENSILREAYANIVNQAHRARLGEFKLVEDQQLARFHAQWLDALRMSGLAGEGEGYFGQIDPWSGLPRVYGERQPYASFPAPGDRVPLSKRFFDPGLPNMVGNIRRARLEPENPAALRMSQENSDLRDQLEKSLRELGNMEAMCRGLHDRAKSLEATIARNQHNDAMRELHSEMQAWRLAQSFDELNANLRKQKNALRSINDTLSRP